MKKEENTKAQEVKKTNLVEGINNLIEEKAEKVEKSKKALKVVGKEKEATEKASEKKVKKTKKEKLVDKTKKKVEANLVEEVVTKREVKYIYPADCEDTLSRKKFRQQVRNKIHQLESRTKILKSSRKPRRSILNIRINS